MITRESLNINKAFKRFHEACRKKEKKNREKGTRHAKRTDIYIDKHR